MRGIGKGIKPNKDISRCEKVADTSGNGRELSSVGSTDGMCVVGVRPVCSTREVMFGAGSSGVSIAGVGTSASADVDAFVAGERAFPAFSAREDDARAGFAANAGRVRDRRAVFALARRSATTARLEGLRRVEAFVCE